MISSIHNTNLGSTQLNINNAGSPFMNQYDIDPISPRINTQPGVLSATGPSVFIPTSTINTSGAMMASGYVSNVNGYGNGGLLPFVSSGGVVDADPITPGIQLQSGVFTASGPSRVIGTTGSVLGGLGVANTGGIVASSAYNVSNNTGVFGRNSSLGQIVDMDPISPGIQAQPGVLTLTGPSTVVAQASSINRVSPVINGYLGDNSLVYESARGLVQKRNYFCCPWWLWTLLSLLFIGGILGGIYSFKPKNKKRFSKSINISQQNTSIKKLDNLQTSKIAKDIKTIQALNTPPVQPKQQENKNTIIQNKTETKEEEKESEDKEEKPIENKQKQQTKEVESKSNENNNIQSKPQSAQQQQLDNLGDSASKESKQKAQTSKSTEENIKTKPKLIKRVTTKTTYSTQTVNPIYSEPTYQHRHLKRYYMH